MKTLIELYKNHSGKVSDKWTLYLREYDRIFTSYRSQNISLLEIGIQNGGSLELWDQYFNQAKILIGCDINPDCRKLSYPNSKIEVIVGDANLGKTRQQILNLSPSFDIIIDDGSHTSKDIINSFANYFAFLNEGGVYVVEDLHCSYWQEFEGGIFYPYSSINFFKILADIVNYENWGIYRSRADLILGFKEKFEIEISESILSEIHSIEFLNSLCIIKKFKKDENILGERFVAGVDELVVSGHLRLSSTQILPLDQSQNFWSTLNKAPAETHLELVEDIKQLRQSLDERDQQILNLSQVVAERDQQILNLRQVVAERDNLINAIYQSRSWRITEGFRRIGKRYKQVRDLIKAVKKKTRLMGGANKLVGKVISVVRREGIKDIVQRAKKVESENRNDYQEWITSYDKIDQYEVQLIKADISSFTKEPLISIVMPVYNVQLHFLKSAIDTVKNQIYQNWELCIADDASTNKKIHSYLNEISKSDSRIKLVFRKENGHISAASNSALELAVGDFVALMDNDDLLPKHALYFVAKTIIENPDAVIIYSDEDKVNADGVRYAPYFKSDFNYELFLAQNMISHLGVYRRNLLEEIGGFRVGFEGAQDYDLALRVLEKIKPNQVVHIPKVLYHWRAIPGSTALDSGEKNYAAEAGRRAVAEHLKRTGRGGSVTLDPETGMFNRVRYSLPQKLPLVTVVIPTRDRADILSVCLDSLLNKTSYKNFEVIVIDNGSIEPSTKKLLDIQSSEMVRVIRDDSPFNYSRLNNNAVRAAKGDVICLMNNDIEIVTPDWLEEMLSFALQPDIGCVGARLWYPDGRLQHGGVILGIGGVAGHAHKYIPKGYYGYFSRAILHQSFSAVTAACLLIRKSIWDEVNGLDESFAVAFNDVDFCLRVREKGYRNIWTPYAEMTHHESLSRGQEDNPEKIARFQEEIHRMQNRWSKELYKDPYYNPNLTLLHEDFSLNWKR